MPHYSINAIVQGADGYLWLGTYYGLVRFDGMQFKVFDKTNTPQLLSNQVSSLAVDHKGRLWIGTSRGLVEYRNSNSRPVSEGVLAGLSIRDLVISADNDLWVATSGNGVFQGRDGRLSSSACAAKLSARSRATPAASSGPALTAASGTMAPAASPNTRKRTASPTTASSVSTAPPTAPSGRAPARVWPACATASSRTMARNPS